MSLKKAAHLSFIQWSFQIKDTLGPIMVCPLHRDLRDCIILIGGLKFGGLVVSMIERYLIQCPLFGVSVKRDSTVVPRRSSTTKH